MSVKTEPEESTTITAPTYIPPSIWPLVCVHFAKLKNERAYNMHVLPTCSRDGTVEGIHYSDIDSEQVRNCMRTSIRQGDTLVTAYAKAWSKQGWIVNFPTALQQVMTAEVALMDSQPHVTIVGCDMDSAKEAARLSEGLPQHCEDTLNVGSMTKSDWGGWDYWRKRFGDTVDQWPDSTRLSRAMKTKLGEMLTVHFSDPSSALRFTLHAEKQVPGSSKTEDEDKKKGQYNED